MKYSIRFKLFAVVSGLIIFYVFVSWFLNSRFLDKYYLYNKRNTLVESYKFIDHVYTGNPDAIMLDLEKLESTKGLHIIFFSRNFVPKYNSMPMRRLLRPRFREGKPPEDNRLFPEFFNPIEVMKGKYLVGTTTDHRLNTDFIHLISQLNNGDYLYLSIPVSAIHESARIANKFFLFTGLFTIITGCIIVFFLARKFTQPILELNTIAQKMAGLDFSRKYHVKTHDEIGELGNNINSLSEQLEKSITELRDANQKLTEDIERERKIDEMRKEFISSVSHELKTPIALIQGYAEGLKLNINDDEENKNYYCDVITDEALKMNRMVKQLLDLTQMEFGYAHLDRVDFQLFPLVEQVIKKNTLIFKETQIRVVRDKTENLTVNADIDRIEQVIVNYLINAINHVDEHRKIVIRIEKTVAKARITVFNSGPHIPHESLQKIWMSFYKVDKARTRDYGGTGLGLSIVRAIQEAHHNNYGVENVEGGVEFWFDLDLSSVNLIT